METLTLEQVKRIAPSTAATGAIEGVSDRYEFYPTIAVVQTLMSEGWVVTKAQEKKVRTERRIGFQKHLIRMSHPSLQLQGEEFIDALIINSHDRSCGYQFMLGIWRLVCSNGMVVGEDFARLNIHHIMINSTEVIKASAQMIEIAPKIKKSIGEFKSIQLALPEQITFANQAAALAFGEDGAVTPEMLLAPARQGDAFDNSLWATFNTVQERLTKGGIKYTKTGKNGKLHHGTTRGIKAIERDLVLNQGLYQLAADLAVQKN